ncbi:MAG TPA: hypothetical protein PK858_10980, partial [Saprospiraceae bacterium]|nr:hypothetical protein [Saprospiraceae bacterium]
ETRIERFRSASAEIWTRQDNFPLGEFLAPGFDILESYLGEFEGNDARLKRLEELLAAAEALLKKLEGIDLEGLDPDKIRQQVLDALAEWRTQIDAALKELNRRADELAAADTQHNPRLGAAEAALLALQQADAALGKSLADLSKKADQIAESDTQQNTRLGAAEAALLALQQADAALDKSLADLLKQLAALQESDGRQNNELGDLNSALAGVLKSLGDLSKSDEKQNQKIRDLEDALLALDKKVGGLVLGTIDPEKIKQAVIDALAQWRSEVGNALLNLQNGLADTLKRVAAVERAVEDLKKKVEGLDLEGLKPEKIRQQVLDALAEWQQKLEAALAALDLRVKELAAGLETTNKVLKNQGERISTAETTLTGHKSALDQLRTDLNALAEEVRRIIT